MRWITHLIACLLIALAATGALAQDAAPDPSPTLAQLRAQFDKLPKPSDTGDDVKDVLAQVDAINRESEKFAAARTGQLSDLNARLGELGNPPAAGAPEDPMVTRQRANLLRERNAVDADIRLARLLGVDAQQRAAELLNQRRALFEARVTERAASPLSREFWVAINEAWPDDVAKIKGLWVELRANAASALSPERRNAILGGLLMALALAVLGGVVLERLLVRLAQQVLPGGRLRRSLLVIAIVTVNVLLFGMAAHWAYSTLEDQGVLGEQTGKLALTAVQSVVFIAFVVGLGRALLSNPRPSWRLPPIPDALAHRLAPFPWLTALVSVVVWVPAQVNVVVQASFAAVLASEVFSALMLTWPIWLMLMRLRAPEPDPSARRAAGEAAAAAAPPPVATQPAWIGVLIGAAAVMLIAVWVLVAIGYVALAGLLATQLTWIGIVGAASYVLFKFADDLCMAVLSSTSNTGIKLQKGLGVAPQTLDQAAVVLSALLRVAVFFYMIVALAAPLGTSPDELFQRSGKYGNGLAIGEFQIVPSAVLGAIGVLVIGFVALGVFKRWLEGRYLPHTTIEAEMRSSITTLLGYVGGVMVVAFALSALGIGINRIAWVASALSVGIGFGLQAIVQNFISGLILLAERPVKVGDWVVLGGTEGDVRRINVRATEIQLADRSTMIVPNSEFITKTVRNMTLTSAGGRVLITLPLPLTTDAKRVRALMLDAFAMHPDVLADPAPQVQLNGIEGGLLMFQATGYVSSPRIAGNVRSDLLFSILEALRTAELPLSVPTMMLAPPPIPAQATVVAAGPAAS